ncbi:UNVERIFIED_CONTAM: hypothetical protein Slati_4414500 [Sesamum latifolium]|uniref:Uncharacterized protein n=1 Tax=Sesamum latifolium TaxID=2727402 RepID=A0AAW2SPX9_9LAMI
MLDMSEVCGASGDNRVAMEEFQECIDGTKLITLPMQGEVFTWHKCSYDNRSLWKRLDRMLVNDLWMERWPNASYLSFTPRMSDHSPLVLVETQFQQVRYIITVEDSLMLLKPVTANEVKMTVFDIVEDKSPGPDGYSFGFYKAWPIVGEEVTQAIMEFFTTGRLLKQVNTTHPALIQKRLSIVLDRIVRPS